ncbi:MAG: alpha/beta hydrolase family protein, partial [Bacteroidia bacterium]
ANEFAKAGFCFLKFNFSFNGTTIESPCDFVDLDAFGKNNYCIELNDLGKIIDWSVENLSHIIDINSIFLIGHSRGGGIAILKACEDVRIKKLVTWASISNLINRNSQKTIEEWKKKGVVFTLNGRTKQQMPLYYQFYETIQQNKQRLDIIANSGTLKIPYTIIHGKKDDAVNYSEAEQLKKCFPHAKLISFENGNHTFGAKHPFDENNIEQDTIDLIDQSIGFLKEKAD